MSQLGRVREPRAVGAVRHLGYSAVRSQERPDFRKPSQLLKLLLNP